MTFQTDLQERFQSAWTDLDERLISGLGKLRNLAETTPDPADKSRLLDKASGLDRALEIWEAISHSDHAQASDFAEMWRTFTSEAAAVLAADGYQPGFYQGIHLALTYQRGYGADVDAPVIPNPHA